MALFRRRTKPEADHGDADGIIREKIDGQSSVRFYCGDLPADKAVVAAGHEPNGYFWEGVLRFVDADLVNSMELDSEAGMFAAYGKAEQCERVSQVLGPLISDPEAVARLVARAEAAGHDFDD